MDVSHSVKNDAQTSVLIVFLPILLACNLRCTGVNEKLKWLVQGGNDRKNDSTLPRLLTSVYTPLLRCATASDACGLACGLRNKQTGSCCQVPRFAFLAVIYAPLRATPGAPLKTTSSTAGSRYFRAVCGVWNWNRPGMQENGKMPGIEWNAIKRCDRCRHRALDSLTEFSPQDYTPQ